MNKLFFILLLLPCAALAQNPTIKVPFKQIETASDSNYTIRSNASGIFRPQILPYNVFSSNNTAFGNRFDDGSKIRLTGPVRIDLGTDQWGDMYYRDSLGILTRIPRPSANYSIITWLNGVPSWRRDYALSSVMQDSLAAVRADFPVIPEIPPVDTPTLQLVTTKGASSTNNISIGTGTPNIFGLSIVRSNTDGGSTNAPALELRNSYADDPSGGGTNGSWINLASGNGAVTGQIFSNYGTGQYAPYSLGSGLYLRTTGDHDIKMITGTTPVERFRVNATGAMIPVSSGYLNFSTTAGTSGYGIRDNAGTMQFKNSGGSWADLGSGGGGGSSQWTTNAGEGIYYNALNLVAIGSATTTSDLTGTVLDVNGYIKTRPGKGIISNSSGGFSTTLIRNTTDDHTEYYGINSHKFYVQGQEKLRLTGVFNGTGKLSYIGGHPEIGSNQDIPDKQYVDSAITANASTSPYHAKQENNLVTSATTTQTVSTITVEDNTTGIIDIWVLGMRQSSLETFSYRVSMPYKKISGNVTTGTAAIINPVAAETGVSGSSVTITQGSGSILIQVTPGNANAIEWRATTARIYKGLSL